VEFPIEIVFLPITSLLRRLAGEDSYLHAVPAGNLWIAQAIQRAKKSQQVCVSRAPSRCGGEKTVLWSLGGSEKFFAGGKIDHHNKQPTDARKAPLERALMLSLSLPPPSFRWSTACSTPATSTRFLPFLDSSSSNPTPSGTTNFTWYYSVFSLSFLPYTPRESRRSKI